MGLLVNGSWVDQWYDTQSSDGKFVRSISQFRNWITEDGATGESGEGDFKAESGRYHLYVSYACPWANRVLAVRTLKGLEQHITHDVVHPIMLKKGWTFTKDDQGANGDSQYQFDFLHQIYTKVDAEITTRVTVPILWDKERETIVSNESAEIIRMLNSAFQQVEPSSIDLYPEELRHDIDQINQTIYQDINNGVYLAGFATTQAAYDQAVTRLFNALDQLEIHLAERAFLIGERLTEADIRLAMTLFRFDLVYVQHFKTDMKRIVDYPNLWRFTRRIYQLEGIAETVNFDHIRTHYFKSHPTINPYGIVPIGPKLDWWASLSQ
jgi:glutathionyl-hydroquinone reductase